MVRTQSTASGPVSRSSASGGSAGGLALRAGDGTKPDGNAQWTHQRSDATNGAPGLTTNGARFATNGTKGTPTKIACSCDPNVR